MRFRFGVALLGVVTMTSLDLGVTGVMGSARVYLFGVVGLDMPLNTSPLCI